jgi:hypothetical protein
MNMKTIAATLLLALSAAGAEPQSPSLRTEPTGGGSIFYVKNIEQKPLTAFVIELVDYPGSSYSLWEDYIVSGDPIAPGQEKKIMVQNMTVGAVPDYVKIRGAIYADGSSVGLAKNVTALIDRRRAAMSSLQDLTHRLEMAKDKKVERPIVINSVRQAAEFMVLPPNTDKTTPFAISRTVGRTLFLETAAYLDNHTIEQTLEHLQSQENALKSSKPAL